MDIERIAALQNIGFFASLSDQTLQSIAEALQVVTVSAGQTIFQRGEPGDALYIIARGKVRVHRGDLLLNYLGQNEFFGEMAVLDRERRSASVTAVVDTLLYRLDHEALHWLIAERPDVAFSIIQILSHRLRASMEDLSIYYQDNSALAVTVAELEQRNRDMRILIDMSGMLQTCKDRTELDRIVVSTAARLFAQMSGTLYLFDERDGRLRPAGSWGALPIMEDGSLSRCMALRHRQTHFTHSHLGGVACGVCTAAGLAPSVCIPVQAQNDQFGLLYLLASAEPYPDWGRIEALARLLADHVALALSNLRLRDQLVLQSLRDPLTGLHNRRFMQQFLARAAVELNGEPLSIIVLDIDHFKQYNTDYGLGGGDAALRAMGGFLREQVGPSEASCRIGGEEFMLILPGVGLADAARRAEQIRQAVKEVPVRHQRGDLRPLAVSVGTAAYPDHGSEIEVVIEAANQALRQAKVGGRDRVVAAPDEL